MTRRQKSWTAIYAAAMTAADIWTEFVGHGWMAILMWLLVGGLLGWHTDDILDAIDRRIDRRRDAADKGETP